MTETFVWSVIMASAPPKAEGLDRSNAGYRFYPFSHGGRIVTADVSLWKRTGGAVNAALQIQWPSEGQINHALHQDSPWTLLVTTTHRAASTIDPNVEVSLVQIPALPQTFVHRGYDIIDHAGISGLANVGLTQGDVARISALSLTVNTDGLLGTPEAGEALSAEMEEIAPEHAPFFVVSVVARTLA